jgi:hypothetical protein
LRFIWKGKWKGGEISIEAETLEEINNVLGELFSLEKAHGTSGTDSVDFPALPGSTGCVDAIRSLMQTEWGKSPRAMVEIKEVLEANGLHFTKGTLSGTLTLMTQRGNLRRFRKNGKWVYVPSQS